MSYDFYKCNNCDKGFDSETRMKYILTDIEFSEPFYYCSLKCLLADNN